MEDWWLCRIVSHALELGRHIAGEKPLAGDVPARRAAGGLEFSTFPAARSGGADAFCTGAFALSALSEFTRAGCAVEAYASCLGGAGSFADP